jgi:hypothetical protein
MGDPINKDDERWLEALAGKPDLDAADPVVAEALALRKPLQVRAQRLDAAVPTADDALLEQLRFRLRREGLSGKKPVFRRPAAWALAASVVLGVGLGVRIGLIDDQPGPSMVESPGIPSTPTEPEPTAPEQLAFATLVAAADPKAMAEELIHSMPMDPLGREKEVVGLGAGAVFGIMPRWRDRLSWDDAKGSFQALSGLFQEQVESGVPVVIELGQDRIMLVVQATDAMLEYLRSQNIEPTVTDGEIVLLIHLEDARPPVNPSPDASL